MLILLEFLEIFIYMGRDISEKYASRFGMDLIMRDD